MTDEKDTKSETTESSVAKPTITIAERDKESSLTASKPTITIAERDGEED